MTNRPHEALTTAMLAIINCHGTNVVPVLEELIFSVLKEMLVEQSSNAKCHLASTGTGHEVKSMQQPPPAAVRLDACMSGVGDRARPH